MGGLRWLLVPSLEHVEHIRLDPATEKTRICEVWSANPNLVRDAAAECGSLEVFQQIGASRRVSHGPLYALVPSDVGATGLVLSGD